jgi:hypothetical protein
MRRVLVIEDRYELRYLLPAIIQQMGFATITAENRKGLCSENHRGKTGFDPDGRGDAEDGWSGSDANLARTS